MKPRIYHLMWGVMSKILIDSTNVRLNSLQIIKFLHLRRHTFFFLQTLNLMTYVGQTGRPLILVSMTMIQVGRPRIRDPISGILETLFPPFKSSELAFQLIQPSIYRTQGLFLLG
jgi:hypothetical protein